MEETRGEMVANSLAGTQLPKAKLEETVLETSPENRLCRARSLGQEAVMRTERGRQRFLSTGVACALGRLVEKLCSAPVRDSRRWR